MSDSAQFTIAFHPDLAFSQDPDKGLQIITREWSPGRTKLTSWTNYFLQHTDGTPASLQDLAAAVKGASIEFSQPLECPECLAEEVWEPGEVKYSLIDIEVEQNKILLTFSASDPAGCNHSAPQGEVYVEDWYGAGLQGARYLGAMLVDRMQEAATSSEFRIVEESYDADETVVEVDGKPTKISFKAYSGN
jgi:hypothetical protein